jgi:hypothetical protein
MVIVARGRTAGWWCALAAVTLLPAACASDGMQIVSVQPAPAPATVTFVLADRSLIYGLSVLTCAGRVMWTLSNERNGGAPVSITYGVTPDGFASRVGPKPLTPDCYDVIVSGPSRTRFRIGADGKLVPPPTAP